MKIMSQMTKIMKYFQEIASIAIGVTVECVSQYNVSYVHLLKIEELTLNQHDDDKIEQRVARSNTRCSDIRREDLRRVLRTQQVSVAHMIFGYGRWRTYCREEGIHEATIPKAVEEHPENDGFAQSLVCAPTGLEASPQSNEHAPARDHEAVGDEEQRSAAKLINDRRSRQRREATQRTPDTCKHQRKDIRESKFSVDGNLVVLERDDARELAEGREGQDEVHPATIRRLPDDRHQAKALSFVELDLRLDLVEFAEIECLIVHSAVDLLEHGEGLFVSTLHA